MEFLEYQSNCPFTKFGLKDGYLSEFELTCRRKDNIPAGHSWGVCDEKHCPAFGVKIKMRDIVIRDSETGEVLAVADKGSCRAVELHNTMSYKEFAEKDKEALQYIEAQLKAGYIDLVDYKNIDEISIIRKAIRLYKESMIKEAEDEC